MTMTLASGLMEANRGWLWDGWEGNGVYTPYVEAEGILHHGGVRMAGHRPARPDIKFSEQVVPSHAQQLGNLMTSEPRTLDQPGTAEGVSSKNEQRRGRLAGRERNGGMAKQANNTRRRGKVSAPRTWELRLYVAGQTPRCVDAFGNLKRICEEHLAGRYRIEVVDLLKDTKLARGDQIVAIPTLVRKLPSPMKKIIGDLSNKERVLVGLDLRPV